MTPTAGWHHFLSRHPDSDSCQALMRLNHLCCTMEKKTEMKMQFETFRQNIFDCDHAELAHPLQEELQKDCWYLPIFGVYYHQKSGQIEVVFHYSAKLQSLPQNSVLLSGTDLNNSLLHFRREQVAVTVDTEHMFQSFVVGEDNRTFYISFATETMTSLSTKSNTT